MRKTWYWGLLGFLFGFSGLQLNAQSTDQRLRIGAAIGFEGTTFINNPFNNLISEIRIPGITGELNGRVRFGKHFSMQLTPAYNIRPYRSHRVFVADSLNPNGAINPLGGKTIDRQLRGDLYEARLGLSWIFHFKDTQSGFYIGAGAELQSVRLRNFQIIMTADSSEILNSSSEKFGLPLLAGAQLLGGYTWSLPNGMLLQAEPFIKYSPLFTKDAAFLSWGSAGFRVKWWL